MTNQLTVLGLGVILCSVGMYDLWLGITEGPHSTISSLFRGWSHDYPILPFAAGALAAHLFGF